MERLTEWIEKEKRFDRISFRTTNQQLIDKLAEYEELEKNGRMKVFQLSIGQEIYFIGRDKFAAEKIKGDWYVLSPCKIVEVSTSGFWTGSLEDFPNNADFTAWTDTDYYTSYQEAKEAIERMVG